MFKGVTKTTFFWHRVLNMFWKIVKLNFYVCLFFRKIIFYSEWKGTLKNSILKMSWKCAFQARPPVAFRAVQFQLNFQPYVLSRLSPSLAEQKGQLQTAKSAVLCFALTKAEKLQCVQIITSFCFACWFEVWFSLAFYIWEIWRNHNWPEKKLFYAI